MIYIKDLQIKLPKWKWWQVIVGLVVIILVYKLSDGQALELLKELKELVRMWYKK